MRRKVTSGFQSEAEVDDGTGSQHRVLIRQPSFSFMKSWEGSQCRCLCWCQEENTQAWRLQALLLHQSVGRWQLRGACSSANGALTELGTQKEVQAVDRGRSPQAETCLVGLRGAVHVFALPS